jgi:hypothetical protein
LAANLFTHPALDPFGKIAEFKYCAATPRPAEAGRAAAAARPARARSRRSELARVAG